MTTDAEARAMWPRARGRLEPPATGRGRKPPPLETPAPATPWFQTSDLQNREVINFCISKLPSTSPVSGALLQQLQEANKLGKPGSPYVLIRDPTLKDVGDQLVPTRPGGRGAPLPGCTAHRWHLSLTKPPELRKRWLCS